MALYDTLLVNGTNLAAYARIVETWGGTMRSTPHRGANLVFPGVPGATFVPKVRDVGSLSLGLVVLAVDPATGIEPPATADRMRRLNANWRALLALVDNPAAPLTLTRRVSLPTGDLAETASAELASVLEPTLIGLSGARCVVDLTILTPWTALP